MKYYPDEILLNHRIASVFVDEEYQLEGLEQFKYTGKNLNFVSNDESIATVNAAGVVKGVAAGETVIVVSDKDNPNLKVNVPVIVSAEIDENTALVSVMWANNEIGNIFPVRELAEMAHAKGALFHADAVQAVGKVPINLAVDGIDFLSLSGHKLHAPKGVGALYVRRGIRFHPFVIGGHQENGRRAGTENVASLVGLGVAAELAKVNMEKENTFVRSLRDTLEQGVVATIKDVRVNGDVANRLPNTTNISFEYIEGESILMLLDQFGICASSGSACTTGSLEPSHVLRAMALPYTAAHGAIRFSFSRYNTMDEVKFTLEKLPPIIARLREISPYGK